MALDHNNQQQIKWNSGNNSYSLSGSTSFNSDAMTVPDGASGGSIVCKADHGGTPGTDDYVDFYLLPSTGDPDADPDSADEYVSDNHGIFVCRCDTNVDDPALNFGVFSSSFFNKYKIRAENNAGESVTISAEVNWGVVS